MAVTSPKKQRVSKPPAHWLPPPQFAVVQIPRAVWSAAYWSLDWAHLYALAQTGQNGLCVRGKSHDTPQAPVDTAWMRNVDGVACLYHQNWRG